ncbi:hypothetical protein [Psychroserpens algicola]|uniref:Uncharacterized protein n=1 Tax=Psychroserpens algicola TaxID=1719034 RepID=A0ABT0H6L7_9FLAO|nr:hypothetical protein [Psychroserpens algicola]MCK8479664.1 hypothetical protein [Psychroserpens algicola]
MAVSPLTESSMVSFYIISNGVEIQNTIEISAIEIEQNTNAQHKAFITVNDGHQNHDKFEVTDSKTFQLDNLIEIKLGYDSKVTRVFKGLISSRFISGDTTGNLHLNIICNTRTSTNVLKKPIEQDWNKAPVLKLTFGKDVMNYELLIHEDNSNQIEGFVSFVGFANTNVNDTLQLEGFGNTFSSTYIISKVIHHVADGDWITTAFITGKIQ